MARRISDEGLAHLRKWEGLRLEAYRDTGGVWTIGYGHTGPDVVPGRTITEVEAETLLCTDILEAERAVTNLVRVPLTDNQFAALVSFVFNVGPGAFAKSTLLRKLNAGDYDAVPSELARWNKDNGRTVKGLANRRAAEIGLWAKGAFVASAGPTTAQPAPPPAITKENVTAAVSVLSGGAAVFAGSGPVQWALGAVIVMAAAAAVYLFVRQRMNPA